MNEINETATKKKGMTEEEFDEAYVKWQQMLCGVYDFDPKSYPDTDKIQKEAGDE